MTGRALFGIFVWLVAMGASARNTLSYTFYAAPSSSGDGNCLNWANACTLQTALNRAISGDEIWVKAGVHKPSSVPTNRTATFLLKSGVKLYGGFAGTEVSLEQRSWQTNITILSGDIDNNDTDTNGDGIVDLSPGQGDAINGANSYHVVMGEQGATSDTILDGFVITAGLANGSGSTARGAGIHNINSSPTIRNCIFTGNAASDRGGGMYNSSSHPIITNSTFTGNTASYGGAMYNYQSSPTVTHCTFRNNLVTNRGGGIYTNNSNPTIRNCIFGGNSASLNGGGVFIDSDSSPTITDCTFSGNAAIDSGGAIYVNSGSPIIMNCTFSGNTAGKDGGGIFNFPHTSTIANCILSNNTAGISGGGLYNYYGGPTIKNCLFTSNVAIRQGGGIHNYSNNATIINCAFVGNGADRGGGIFNSSSDPTITNCTFSGNSASDSGGGIYNYSYSDPIITNSILWGDIAPNGPEIYNYNSTPNVTYSVVQGGYIGTGNIDQDPLFVSSTDLRLQAGSPAIDAGSNAAVPSALTTDIEGNPRIVDGDGNGIGTVDMGAYEYQRAQAYTLTIGKSGTGSGTVTSDDGGINCGTDCTEAYASATIVNLSATANVNSSFGGWGGDCSACGLNSMCTITMDSDQSCQAAFVLVSGADLVGEWLILGQRCRQTSSATRCVLRGKFRVTNQGNIGTTRGAYLYFYLSSDPLWDSGDELLDQIFIRKLRPAQSDFAKLKVSLNFPLGQTASGMYVIAQIDATDVVEELDETNNLVGSSQIP